MQKGAQWDSWCSNARTLIDCVPLLSCLMLEVDDVTRLGLCPDGNEPTPKPAAAATAVDEEEEAQEEAEPPPPPPVRRREDAPALCVVSNLGVAQTEEGATALRHDGSAQSLISAALIRLAAELHMLPEYNTAKCGRTAAKNTEPLESSGTDLATTAGDRLGVTSRFVSFVRDVQPHVSSHAIRGCL